MAKKTIMLTEKLRQQITHEVVSAIFDERFEKLKMVESALFDKVLNQEIGEKNLKLMAELPAEYFVVRSIIYIQEPNANYNDRVALISHIGGRKAPGYLVHGGSIELPKTHGLWKEIRAIIAEKKNAMDERKEATLQTRAILNSVKTVKKLIEVWPEVERFVPTVEEEKALPAVQMETLNAMLAKASKGK